MSEVAPGNAEERDAWSGALFERFLRFRETIGAWLGAHGEAALAARPPQEGDRVLDLGCGFGDTTRQLAALVGESGAAVGVDISERFLELAREEAAQAGLANVDYRVADAQVADLDGPYDYVFSRFGVMFFDDPTAALANVRAAMRPGARLCVVVWRRKVDNGWINDGEEVVARYVDRPPGSDEPGAGPGPFSLANADLVSDRLQAAGFETVEFRRCDIGLRLGGTVDEAVEVALRAGPAEEALREAGDRGEELRPRIVADLRAALADRDTGDGVYAPSSSWIVSARVPASS